jgi:hypothetical protein
MTYTPACRWLFGYLREKGNFPVTLVEQLFLADQPAFDWTDVLDGAESLGVSVTQDVIDEEWYWCLPAYQEVRRD